MSTEKQSTKACRFCKTEIPSDAKICPNCRKKQGNKLPVIIAVVVVLVIILALAGGGNSSERGTDSNPKKVATSADAQNVKEDGSETSDDTEAPADIQNSFSVGDVVETSNLNITYVSAQPYTSDNEFLQPAEGNEYYRMEFEFENVGDSDQYISAYEFECYADSYATEAAYLESDYLSANISSGRKAKIVVYFEIPVQAEEVVLEYTTNFWSENKVEFQVK